MASKGFTLIESLVVLFIISIILLLMPKIKQKGNILKYEMYKLSNVLSEAQTYAINHKEKVHLTINNNKVTYNNKEIIFDKALYCDQTSLHFTARGNVNLAQTITCSLYDDTKQLVINLGSGSHYVK